MTEDKERIAQLENALARMLERIRDIPLSVAVKALTGHIVIPINRALPEDNDLIDRLVQVARIAGKETQTNPIIRPRPNEVGNDMEPYVERAARSMQLTCAAPASRDGSKKKSGYPDLLVTDTRKRPTYLEVKSYAAGAAHTSFRSFYFSPSDNPKVTCDARHLVLGFGVVKTQIAGTENAEYRATTFTLVDVHDLSCDVKNEFQSDNLRLYAENLVLASGTI